MSNETSIEFTKLDFTRAGRTCHQKVGHLREVGTDEVTFDVLAQTDHQWVVIASGARRVQHVGEANHFAVGVRYLDAHRGLTRNGGQEADVVGSHCIGDVAGERGDLLDLDARAEFDLVPRHCRAAGESGNGGVDLELFEDLADRFDHRVVRRTAELGRVPFDQQRRRREVVVAVGDPIGDEVFLLLRLRFGFRHRLGDRDGTGRHLGARRRSLHDGRGSSHDGLVGYCGVVGVPQTEYFGLLVAGFELVRRVVVDRCASAGPLGGLERWLGVGVDRVAVGVEQ